MAKTCVEQTVCEMVEDTWFVSNPCRRSILGLVVISLYEQPGRLVSSMLSPCPSWPAGQCQEYVLQGGENGRWKPEEKGKAVPVGTAQEWGPVVLK